MDECISPIEQSILRQGVFLLKDKIDENELEVNIDRLTRFGMICRTKRNKVHLLGCSTVH